MKKLYEESDIQVIANAIRAKNGESTTYKVSEMAAAIAAISAGSTPDIYAEETHDDNGDIVEAKLHGFTKVRGYMFFGCTNLTLVYLPNNLTAVEKFAFNRCTSLILTSLPNNLISIGESAFYNCTNLALTSLPNSLVTIESSAFYNCTNLAITFLPSNLTIIKGYAFGRCTHLSSISFQSKVNSIASNVFEGCTDLTTINVPWAEGEVANAPWGATNATINYNYIEPTTEETA